MIIEQMLVGPMAVFTYIVGCEEEKECLIIDPAGSSDTILSKMHGSGLTARYVVNTHGHADHTCGNKAILAQTGAELVVHQEDAARISIGKSQLRVIHTPGHTPGSICLYGEGNLFTGDTLFVGAVGRTDLKGGSFETLLKSLKKLLTLPPETRVWPGHHYGDAPVSTLSRERDTNPYITDFLQ
jgi:hydroxyacylglutathione hydrolase